MDEENVKMVSKEIETENIKEMGTEKKARNKKQRRDGKGDEGEGHCRQNSHGSEAVEPKAGSEIELLNSRMKKILFHWEHFVKRPQRRV